MRKEVIELGKRLKTRREICHLLQQQLSDLSAVSVRTIQLVERGEGNPSLQTLIQLAAPLGLRLELILNEPIQTLEP